MKKQPYEDLMGKRFSRLLVVDLRINKKAKKRYRREWVCLCDCGNYKVVRRPDALKKGDIKSCGCYSKETILRAVKAITLPKGEAAFNALYGHYKKEAKNREYEFSITKEQFRSTTKSNCLYCNSKPIRLYTYPDCNGGYLYNGIDRQNNKIGYVLGNYVPCCKTCNFMKGTLSVNKFLSQVDKIDKNSKVQCQKENKPITVKPNIHAVRVIFAEYKKNARVKKLQFKLNEKKFISLTSGVCVYCGQIPSNKRYTQNRKGAYTHNGIDRVDSTKGYEESNCVSCCSTCNYMKQNLTVGDFYKAVKKIKDGSLPFHSFPV